MSGSRLVPPRGTSSTDRDLELLELVHEHRVFTTGQPEAPFFTAPQLARRLLILYRHTALLRSRPWTPTGPAPWHGVLGPTGAAVLAARHGVTLADLGYNASAAVGFCLFAQLGHQLGVNECFTCLRARARHREDARLVAVVARETLPTAVGRPRPSRRLRPLARRRPRGRLLS
ncbi:replication-relaxation family protein [Streptomyces sp. 5-10]|nr:replication-relaxation family protein [Streptomyces sp. 5-10]